ncbi:hypothetical protein MAPG_09995 [Magnaporthiopsis poae ATCC 64411]|uniref:Mediator of RNA polymerase II transcription subunit 11 n=1 Tax=Magnaporthiopsis poae (strain ATCC 64411 / 73-15) TaxID=644358 RepID=A0A0C4EBE8_MAGP6|nr:hypothetical protein MAPG_09995 [Magnaporthiopsis poae ATCC 64411]
MFGFAGSVSTTSGSDCKLVTQRPTGRDQKERWPPPGQAQTGPAGEQPLAPLEQQQQSRAFEAASNDFFATLLSIHVRLKRQIWGLEEAGIITLKDGGAKGSSSSAAAAAAAASAKGGTVAPTNLAVPALEPNGVGAIGNLDVGWLNSRSSKVDRDMEAELWAQARGHLEARANAVAAAAVEGVPAGTQGDVDMPMAD